ncbi:hypothetical protein ABZP36_024529 [Zizania latifolia]
MSASTRGTVGHHCSLQVGYLGGHHHSPANQESGRVPALVSEPRGHHWILGRAPLLTTTLGAHGSPPPFASADTVFSYLLPNNWRAALGLLAAGEPQSTRMGTTCSANKTQRS